MGPSPPAPASVCAVILTLNRRELLLKCIASLLALRRPVDSIIIIDNGSTDGTADTLRQLHPQIEVFRQPTNRGGAGGFGEGLKIAHARGFDWIWLMDDDVEVVPEALDELLKYQHLSKFIQGRRIGVDGMSHLEAFWDASVGACHTLPSDVSFARSSRDWLPVQWACFEGPLIHRSVVDQVGLPDERFFLCGDDMMYGLAASFHTAVIYIRAVVLHRQLPSPLFVSPMRWYLSIRNRFLILEHLQGYGVPVSLHVFRVSILLLVWWSVRQILSGRNGQGAKMESLKMVYAGLADGWRGRFDRLPFLKSA